jgi:hypothetical protein
MATSGGKKKLPSKVSVPDRNYYIPPVPVVPPTPSKSLGEDIMGWVAACFLIALLLPVMGMLYMDILETKHEVKKQVEKVEKLRREVEQQKRKEEK